MAKATARQLTEKRKRFVELWHQGLDGIDAYKQAFGHDGKPTTQSMHAKVQDLRNDLNVQAYLEELQQKTREITVFTTERKMALLWHIAQTSTQVDDRGKMMDAGAAVRAVHEMNIMAGDIAPTKQETKLDTVQFEMNWGGK